MKLKYVQLINVISLRLLVLLGIRGIYSNFITVQKWYFTVHIEKTAPKDAAAEGKRVSGSQHGSSPGCSVVRTSYQFSSSPIFSFVCKIFFVSFICNNREQLSSDSFQMRW